MNPLTGIIDIHVHSSPDIRQRRVSDLTMAENVLSSGARGFVIKSHLFPTMDRAWHVKQQYPQLEVFGGIVLNPSVGGINRMAAELAIKLGARIVYLPTLFSSRHRRMEGLSGGVESVRNGRITPELSELLRLLAEHPQVILSTGHLESEEIFIVVEEAVKRGLKRILVTHPEHNVVGMPIDKQQELLRTYPSVVFERCYAQPQGKGTYQLNVGANLQAIRVLGHESTILSSDSGQLENPIWSDVMTCYVHFMRERGVSEQQLDWMTKRLPARWLDLE